MKRHDRGFTLIEMAIVLVVIGFLLGVVIKGHAIIENARQKAVINQANDLTHAYYGYLDRYGKYPGDDITAPNRWTTNAGNNNGRIDGTEPYLANQHLALAGLIAGTYNGTSDQIRTARYNGNVSLTWVGATALAGLQPLCTNVILITTLPAEASLALDLALDDGIWNTGKVQADAQYTEGTTIANIASCL